MRKSKPHWSLSGTWKSVKLMLEYLTCTCIQRIHNKLSATFSEKYRWLNFIHFRLGLHYAVINKANLVLYIARIIVEGLACETAVCHAATNLKFGRYIALSSSFLWLKRWNLSLSRLRVAVLDSISIISGAGVARRDVGTPRPNITSEMGTTESPFH